MMIRVVLGSSMLAQLEDRTREVRHVSLRVHTLLGSKASLYVLLLESWTCDVRARLDGRCLSLSGFTHNLNQREINSDCLVRVAPYTCKDFKHTRHTAERAVTAWHRDGIGPCTTPQACATPEFGCAYGFQ